MKGFFAVASQEIIAQRRVFLAAAVAAAGPLIAPLLKEPRSNSPAEVRLMAAAFLAFAFAAALSFILGGTALGRDVSGGPLGFYLSRPVRGSAIYAGKLAGAWAVILLAPAIVLLPAVLFDLSLWRSWFGSEVGSIAAAFVGATFVLLAMGSVANLAIRSRSAWVGADLVALVLWIAAMVSIALPLAAAQATGLLQGLGLAVAAGCAAALLAAGGAQVSIGRLDAARGNRVRFAVLWGALFVVAALSFGYVRWLLSPSPRDLVRAAVGSAGSGPWIEVEGAARRRSGLTTSIFFDIETGRYVRARTGRQGAAVISRDGSTAAWTEPSSIWPDGPQDVWMCRLSGAKLERVHTPISTRLWNLEISPDGSIVAAVGPDSIGVYSLATGRLLGAIPQASGDRFFNRVTFPGPGRLRLFRVPSAGSAPWLEPFASVEVADFDFTAKRLITRATIAPIRRPFSLSFDEAGERLIAWERGSSLSLFDAATGRLVSVLANAGWDSASRAFLSDGRIAIGETSGGAGRVHLYSCDGEPETVLETGSAGILRLGGEPVPGTLAIAAASESSPMTTFDASLLDLQTGQIQPLGRHLEPVAARLRWRLPNPAAGSLATLLFSRSDGALLRLDPATMKLTLVLGNSEGKANVPHVP
ncbi:MAG TPA: hypothetical protein VKG01_07165 [Thermoanaerobaculia bacterium]|nr:hypothetical protein [Thermoanaerobaculia bacterium]